jgi:transposase
MSPISVNHWVKRFKSGLKNKPGQGRNECRRQGSLLEAIKQHRQRLQTAKAEWESSRGRSISDSTLRRFLKVLAENMNG